MQELLTAMLNRGLVLPGTKPMQASLLPAIFTPAALAQLCINFCLEIGCVDFLFQSLYPLFLTNKVHYSFLMHLIPFILESKINNLPPKILDNLFEFCISQSRKQLLEQCIYHLNPASLQDSKVLSLCREQKLVGCLFYLYGNLPNSDYTTPLRDVEDLLPLLREHKHIGALVLKYISSCLLGLCFQTNTPIPPAKLYDLRVEVTRYLFIPLLPPDPREFPRLYYLAKFDTATLLKALVPTYNLHTVIAGTPLSCQRMAEILINVIVDKNMIATPSLFGSVSATASSRHDFTVEQQGHLFAFLARYFSKDIITLPPAILSLILHGYLCSPHVLKPFQVTPSSSVSAADLRLQNEQILTEMLPKLLKSSYDVHKLLLLAEGVEFFSVAERIYMHLQNFPKVISTRLKNPQEKTAAFELIQKLYENSALTERQKLDIKASVMQNLPALLQIDSNRLSQLVIEFFAADYQQVLLQLADQPQLQHSFLEQIMSQEGKKMLEKNGIRIAPETHVLYLTLLCQYSSDSVLGYLSSCDDYPLDECIKIVQKHKLMDAELFLLERTGDLSAALTRMIQTIGSQIEGLKLFYRQLHSTSSVQVDQVFPVHTEEKQLTSSLNRAITLCQRNTNRLQDSEVESLWFTLLDTVIIPLRSLKHNKWAAKKITASSSESVTLTAHEASNRSMLKALTYLTNLILTNMMGNVKLTLLLQKIVRDHGKDEFGDLKLVILGVLETYAYETEILKTAQSLLLKDVYYATDSLLRHQQRPLTPKSPNCAMCGRSLLATQNQQVPDTVVFGCGHAVHFSCNPFSESCHLCAQSVKTKKEKPLHPAPRPTSNSTIPAPGVTVSAPAAQASKWQMETYLNRLSRISTSRCLTGITTPDDDDTGKATPKPVFLPKTTAPKMIYRTTPLDPPMYIRSLLENEQNP
ncbi:vacuolar protein sorting-associated protein 8 [Pelomyxa schiedti]|nr:vacuolar protein sorting-associated protein 8 [Pelomyxa schiedti]